MATGRVTAASAAAGFGGRQSAVTLKPRLALGAVAEKVHRHLRSKVSRVRTDLSRQLIAVPASRWASCAPRTRWLECWLVSARDVKNVPGRPETDELDAVLLAKLAERGMVRASFVPPKPVRQLRDLTRTRTVSVQERRGSSVPV